ncbi:hypothetical protein HMPREF9135_0918 [Segatella baroniae F0067]|uniref:Uncharacterized protein n=1 Tax=Segatella baroniae F0067 TaxID=1115809 RepID=U2NJP1_9BACT|nr:hypothetical protein HMPREF9135_0918 [Segatella baroniae F0067]
MDAQKTTINIITFFIINSIYFTQCSRKYLIAKIIFNLKALLRLNIILYYFHGILLPFGNFILLLR